jgi:hypothetical protein
MYRFAILAAIGAMSVSSMAAAETQGKPGSCSFTPTILAAADFLLAEPATFPNFWRDRFGDDAAYLKIRYGGLNYTEGSALLAGLEKRSRPPLRIVELRLAYATKPDRAAMIAGMHPSSNVKSIVPQLGESALRALVTEDGGDWLLGELARWQTSDAYDAEVAATAIAQALADLDDEAKSRLAKRAEDAGVAPLALHLLALRDNLADYVSYLDRVPVSPRPAGLPPDKDRRDRLIREVLYQENLRPFFDISVQPPEIQAVDRTTVWGETGWGHVLRAIGQLVNYTPVTEILLTSVNQSGDRRVGTVVAAGLNAEISAKQLDPISNPDALIVSMVYGLDHIFGHAGREGILGKVGLTEMQGEMAEDFVDRALARLALTPFLQGSVAELPSRPAQLAATFPWELWVGLAGRLKAGEAISPEDRVVAADLMIAAGRPADALSLLKTASDWKTALLRTHGLAFALDRRCADLLGRPIPFSQPLYRFEPR